MPASSHTVSFTTAATALAALVLLLAFPGCGAGKAQPDPGVKQSDKSEQPPGDTRAVNDKKKAEDKLEDEAEDDAASEKEEPTDDGVEQKAGDVELGAGGSDDGMGQQNPEPSPVKEPAAQPVLMEEDSGIGADLEVESGGRGGWAKKRARRRLEEAKDELEEAKRAIGGSAGANAQDLGMQTCETTCQAADAVCQSRDTICEIAQQYRDSSEFRTDCQWADDECNAAQKRCTVCRDEP